MKVYYDPQLFPDAPEYCVAESVEFIQSNTNQIVIESKEDEETWGEIKDNPDGFFEYVESEIYESLDEELKAEYANWTVCSDDLLEHEFVITRPYRDR